MDLSSIMSTLMSGDSVSNMSQLTGTSQEEVQSVLGSVLPSLLSGAQGQAEDQNTAAGFLGALQDHAKADTSNLASFLSNVDLTDGGKIVSHLLGADKESATASAAQQAGISTEKTGSILSAAAPLLMSLMGQQTQETQEQQASSGVSGLAGLFGGGGLDVGSILGGLFGGKK